MAECSQGSSQQCAEINNLNGKLQYDESAQVQNQSLLDNQEDARAWSALKLRIAHNNEAFDHAIRMGSVLAGQAGVTENQQTVSPVRTGTGDAIVGGVGVSAEQVAANVAALSDVVVKFSEIVSALNAMVLAQTQPRSPAAASPTPAA